MSLFKRIALTMWPLCTLLINACSAAPNVRNVTINKKYTMRHTCYISCDRYMKYWPILTITNESNAPAHVYFDGWYEYYNVRFPSNKMKLSHCAPIGFSKMELSFEQSLFVDMEWVQSNYGKYPGGTIKFYFDVTQVLERTTCQFNS